LRRRVDAPTLAKDKGVVLGGRSGKRCLSKDSTVFSVFTRL
jgi:hypothetical protein